MGVSSAFVAAFVAAKLLYFFGLRRQRVSSLLCPLWDKQLHAPCTHLLWVASQGQLFLRSRKQHQHRQLQSLGQGSGYTLPATALPHERFACRAGSSGPAVHKQRLCSTQRAYTVGGHASKSVIPVCFFACACLPMRVMIGPRGKPGEESELFTVLASVHKKMRDR